MTDWIEHGVAALGTRGLETIPEPTPVTIIPDDYNPPRRLAGLVAATIAAAVGFRSQIMLIAAGADRTGTVVEIRSIWITSTLAGTQIELVTRATGQGTFADLAAISSDLRAGRSALRIQTKNDAVAVAATSVSGGGIITGVANVYSGPFELGAILEVGGSDSNAIIFRPSADNVGISIVASYRELRHRKL